MKEEVKNRINENLIQIRRNTEEINRFMQDEYINEKTVDMDNKKNTVSVTGSFDSNDGTESKFANGFDVSKLLELDTEKVTKLLAALGNKERFGIFKLLLTGAKTMNEIMTSLNFETTGKAYHHINALTASGLIFKVDNKYRFKARYISGILIILCGCHSYISKNRNDTISLDSL